VTATPDPTLQTTDPPALVALVVAARRTGDRLRERIARRELETRHGIRVRFANDREVPPCRR
jgi:hypothetical protein